MRSLTPTEAAEATGLHVETVRSYIRAGRLASERVGRFYLVNRRAVDQLAADPPHVGRPRKPKEPQHRPMVGTSARRQAGPRSSLGAPSRAPAGRL